MHLRKSINHSIRGKWIVLFVSIFLLQVVLIFTGEAGQSIIYFLSFLIFSLSSFLLWQSLIFHDVKPRQQFALLWRILGCQLLSKKSYVSITNGSIDGDYIVLQNKPRIRVLTLDKKSAAILQNRAGDFSFFSNGIHLLKNNPKIVGVFDLRLRFFQVGPHFADVLTPKLSGESLTEYHTRINSAEQTKTTLHSGDSVYPAFSVFYKLDLSGQMPNQETTLENLLEIFRTANTSIISNADIEKRITQYLLQGWRKSCKGKTREDVLLNYPGRFKLDNLIMDGIVYQIYIDDIMD